MAMVALIDRPDMKVEVRADIADQYEVCPTCNGFPHRWAYIGGDIWRRWRLYQQYTACPVCEGGAVIRKDTR